MFKASKTQRLFMFNLASLIMVGIWLTGFDKVHWFAYAIPAALYFAATTGLCLGMYMSGKILQTFGIKD